MRQNLQLHGKQMIILCFLTLSSIYSRAQVTDYASLPYHQGFESGVLDSNWYKISSNPNGRIKIWPTDSLNWNGDTIMSVAGTKFLGLDMPTGGVFNQNQVWLGLNTVGASNLAFSFWWSDWNDELHPDDGVYISSDAGITFVKVLALDGGSNPDLNWVHYNLNLDSINLANGLTYTATYVIKFQQYDDYYFAGGNDGFMFDEINIEPVITSAQELSATKFSIYPNPAAGQLFITNVNEKEAVQVNVLNTLGQHVISQTFAPATPTHLNLDIDAGIYFVEIITNNKREVKQFIKK